MRAIEACPGAHEAGGGARRGLVRTQAQPELERDSAPTGSEDLQIATQARSPGQMRLRIGFSNGLGLVASWAS